MKVQSIRAIMQALNQRDVRFLVVGGLAVVAHGYGRVTFDLDLVLDLQPENIRQAWFALESLGFRPRVPVTADQFSDAALRAQWVREKGMTVLNLYSELHPATAVDIFASEPFDFSATLAKAERAPLGDGADFSYVDLDTLILMKQLAGRAKDLDDIEQLRRLRDETG